MILTVTLNPAVDKTVFVRGLEIGAVNRVERSEIDPGGKGINVSRVLHRLGRPTIAFGFLAGTLGGIVTRALDDEGVAHRFAWVDGETRVDVVVVDEATRASTKVYDAGPVVGAGHLDRLLADVRRWLPASRVLVVAGSLPPGVSHDVYVGLLAEAHRCRVPTILDADGDTLRLGLAGRPTLIKPNVAEAEALLGRRLPDLDAAVAGAQELLARGPRVVVVSMGANGSICATGNGVLHVVPPPVERRSTVGSGDSLVAGLATALSAGWEFVEGLRHSAGWELTDGLRLGTAAGAATAMTVGTRLGTPEDIEKLAPGVVIRDIC